VFSHDVLCHVCFVAELEYLPSRAEKTKWSE